MLHRCFFHIELFFPIMLENVYFVFFIFSEFTRIFEVQSKYEAINYS